MGTELSFEAHDCTLNDVLFSQSQWKFRIPRYQRPYSWGEDQLSEFWTDLVDSTGPYFFGSFIFNVENLKETGFLEVIDGQQRMLTVTIMLAALRDLATKLDKETADVIQRHDIAFEDRRGKQSYRIDCGDSAKKFFNDYIQSRESDMAEANPHSPEENKIKANYQFFIRKIDSELQRLESNEAKLSHIARLRDKLADLMVIRIDINGEEDAYEIFETTNARGIDLSIADLLKNLIFRKIPAEKDKDIAKEFWSDIVRNIQETGTELKRFIRYFWISKHSFVTEKPIFRVIKRQTTDWHGLLLDLCSASQDYNRLIEGSREDWLEYKNAHKLFKCVEALKLMGVSQCYVLLLSILRNYNQIGTDPIRIL